MFLCEWSSSHGTSNPWIFGAAQTCNTSWCDKCNEGDKEESIHCWLCKWAWRRGSGRAYFGPCCVILGTACIELQRKEATKGGIGACSSEVVGGGLEQLPQLAWFSWNFFWQYRYYFNSSKVSGHSFARCVVQFNSSVLHPALEVSRYMWIIEENLWRFPIKREYPLWEWRIGP